MLRRTADPHRPPGASAGSGLRRLTRLFAAVLLCAAEVGAGGTEPAYEELLRDVVRSDGVDYARLAARRGVVDAHLAALETADPGATAPEQTAFWINAYNALALERALDAREKVATDGTRTIGGRRLSLDAILDGILRSGGADPRALFAINDGTRAFPPLAPDLYRGDTLDVVLAQQVRAFLADPSVNRFDLARQQAELSAFLSRFRADIERRHAGEPQPLKLFLADHAPRDEIARSLRRGDWLLRFLPPDPSSNEARDGRRPGEGAAVHPLWIALYVGAAALLLAVVFAKSRPPPEPPSPPATERGGPWEG